MGLFLNNKKKEEIEKRVLKENQARHKFWGMDFAPHVSDKDPDKWLDEYDMMEWLLEEDED